MISSLSYDIVKLYKGALLYDAKVEVMHKNISYMKIWIILIQELAYKRYAYLFSQ